MTSVDRAPNAISLSLEVGMLRRVTFIFSMILAVSRLLIGFSLLAQSQANLDPFTARPTDRITSAVNDQRLVTLGGNLHPLARPSFLTGVVPAETQLEKMILVLKPDAAQTAALDALLEAQQDPASPLYHQGIAPETFAQHFGISDSDLEKVSAWLTSQGFTVEEVPTGRGSLIFSGASSRVEAAFHLRMQRYSAGRLPHLANSASPQIPVSLAGVVAGVVSLHDFRSAPTHQAHGITPAYTYGSNHYLAPADFATIYDVNGLSSPYIDGRTQSIAVVGRSNIALGDVRQFRSLFSLPAKDPVVIVNGSDPGTANGGDLSEATLDVEWAGAVAKNATIDFVTSKSTNVSDGTYLSAQYIVNHNLAPILTYSYGLCEAWLGAAENSFLSALWQQAAAQGISVFVSSGDSGAAGCDVAGATTATNAKAVNGLCSPPNSTCVGGTQFNDIANPALYWNWTNTTSGGSARTYIPEQGWNESGRSGLWSSGGGASSVYAKPAWQLASGVPSDGHRDVPDIALNAAGHDGYLVVMNSGLYAFSGTSAAAPAFAGLMALVVQHAGVRQGNANPTLYRLASRQQTGMGSAIFHDITTGNNSVPGASGFSAKGGYDQVTGLGSVDAQLLVTHWAETAPSPTLSLVSSATSVSVMPGGNTTVTLTTTINGGFSSPVSFSTGGFPPGVVASFSPASLAAPGAGNSVLHLSVGATRSPVPIQSL